MRDLKREGNSCRESRHAEQFHFLTLNTQKAFPHDFSLGVVSSTQAAGT